MNNRSISKIVRSCALEALEGRRLLSADLSDTLVGKVPLAVGPDGVQKINVRLNNVGDSRAKGTATIDLFASSDTVIDSSDTLLVSRSGKITLRSGGSITVPVKFSPPATLASGDYYIVARVTGDTAIADTNNANDSSSTSAPISFTQPLIDLSGQIKKVGTKLIKVSAKGKTPVSFSTVVSNSGNASVLSPVVVNYYLSTDQTLDNADLLVVSKQSRQVRIKPGKSVTLVASAKLSPDTPTGFLYVLAKVNPNGSIVETDESNNISVAPTQMHFNNPLVPEGPFILGPATVDANKVIVGSPGLIRFSAHVSEPTSSTALIVNEVDADGNIIGKITDLYDTGNSAVNDATAGDGRFNGLSSIGLDAVGARYFTVVLADSSTSSSQTTAAITIAGVEPPSEAQLQRDSDDASAMSARALGILSNHGTSKSAVSAVKKALKTNENVSAESIVSTNTTIQWTSVDGILHMLDTTLLRSGSVKGGSSATTATALPSASSTSGELTASDTSTTDEGGKAIGISPFAYAFEPMDEVNEIDAMLRAKGYDVVEYRNASSTDTNVTVDTFKNLGQYDAVVISSHGGLGSQGPTILTGQPVTLAGVVGNLWDLITQRVVLESVNNTWYFSVTPAFITAYTGGMDGTIVYSSSCHSAQTTALADAFLGRGAASFIGYTETVNPNFADPKGIDAFTTLLKDQDNTVGDIPGIDVATDPYMNQHAKFVEIGDINATLPHGLLLKNNDLYVNYNWPQTQRDLDSNTTFLGISEGWSLSNSPFISWSGDDTSAGGTEVSIVDLYDAWSNSLWADSTSVTVGADWYTPAHGSGPAFITVALKNKNTGELTHTWSRVVNPGQEDSGAQTTLATVNITLSGNPQNPTVHIQVG